MKENMKEVEITASQQDTVGEVDKGMKEVIKAEKLCRNYVIPSSEDKKESEEIKVIKGIDLEVCEGEFVGIMGKSGCGKTTLIKVLGMIDKPTGGTVFFKGMDTKELWAEELADIRRRELGFVFQDFYLMDSLTIRNNIILPMVLDKKKAKVCLKKGEELAEQFGITHLLKKHPYELSGGEKQRVAICRALINNPDLILADEPTGNLDTKSGNIVVEEFKRVNEELGKTIVMVTHDPKMASNCKRILFLRDGQILEDITREGKQEAFYEQILERMKDL